MNVEIIDNVISLLNRFNSINFFGIISKKFLLILVIEIMIN